MTWQDALQLSNLILIPAIIMVARLEKRLTTLEVKLSAAISILAEHSGIDLGGIRD